MNILPVDGLALRLINLSSNNKTVADNEFYGKNQVDSVIISDKARELVNRNNLIEDSLFKTYRP